MKYKIHWIESVKATVLFWRMPKHLLEKCQTYICCSADKVFGQYGAMDITTIESKREDVNGVKVEQTLLGRLLNYGTIYITTPSTVHSIKNISKPHELKREILKEM